MLENITNFVKIVEVGPRDGLQNESQIITTADKVSLINLLIDSGIKNIEVTSFVSPKWIPQLADGLDVVKSLNLPDSVITTALVPNLKGYEMARIAKLKQVSFFMSATETHNQKNINKSISNALTTIKELVNLAKSESRLVRCYLSCSFYCPYEGKVDINAVLPIVNELFTMGIDEISIGDTIGYATPLEVATLLKQILLVVPSNAIAMHFHDTCGVALANVLTSLDLGITTFDSSIGGLGGCPYAPGASGNLATEDLTFMLHGLGIKTGIDLDKLIQASSHAQLILNHLLPGKYLQASLGKLKKCPSTLR